MVYVLCKACTADEFQCTDGMCVPWQQTCDGTSHCMDNSDEGSVCGKRTVDITLTM